MKMVMSISTAAQTTSSSEEEAAVTRGDWFIGGEIARRSMKMVMSISTAAQKRTDVIK